jgi:hypothetical protein
MTPSRHDTRISLAEFQNASVSSDRRAQGCPRQTYLGDDLRLIFDPHGGRLDELSVPYACQQLPSDLSAQPHLSALAQ